MLASPLVARQRAVIVQSIGTEVCVCVCVRNLISLLQHRLRLGRGTPATSITQRSSWEEDQLQRCQGGVQASVRTSLYPRHTHPEPQTPPPAWLLNPPSLRLPNSSFLVFHLESNNLIPGPCVTRFPPPPCSQRSALLPHTHTPSACG